MENLKTNKQIRDLHGVPLLPGPEEISKILKQLKDDVFAAPKMHTCKDVQQIVATVIKMITISSSSNQKYDRNLKRLVVEIIKVIGDKRRIDNLNFFFNILTFLVVEIYDHQQCTVHNISEEYKLLIVQTITSVMRSITDDITQEVFTAEHTLRLSPIFYSIMLLARNEQLRTLRIAAIECLMALAKVDDYSDHTDLEIRYQVSDVFKVCLPGVIEGLSAIAVEDEIRSHKVALLAVRAWGRIVSLVLQNYNAIDNPIINEPGQFLKNQESCFTPQHKWKTKEEVDAYLQSINRTPMWYQQVDKKLCDKIASLKQLSCHSHPAVRLELMHCCLLLVETCSVTIPATVSKAIEILILLSEDEDNQISQKSCAAISAMSERLSIEISKNLMDNLEEGFYCVINDILRVRNSLDACEQLSTINLFIGYVKLFGSNNLSNVLHSISHLKRLLQTFIQFCELERDITMDEEYFIQDLDVPVYHSTPWKNLRYCRGATVQRKLELACGLLAEYGAIDIINVLLECFIEDEANRIEITLILNNVLTGLKIGCNLTKYTPILKNVLNTYLEFEYWYLPLEVSDDCTLPEVKNNIIQICLQLEGLGKIALILQAEFRQFLLKVLYAVLEYAGSSNQLIKSAGIATIANISTSCGYANVTELITHNMDYFSHHVIRKIHHAEQNKSVLNVLCVVIQFTNVDVLDSISYIIEGVLMQTCDKYFQERNGEAYLKVFQVFIKSLMKWFNVEVKIETIKSKLQRKKEYEDFQISNLDADEDLPNTEIRKSAEELYKEDVEKRRQEQELIDNYDLQDEGIKKEELPNHVKLTSLLLERCLNFLPSRNRTRKLLVLEILKDGLEIIRDWENTLLPLVHKIWSPLIGRFKERDDLLIINYSFQLLVTLARLSKDFIRSRTAKDVLPEIIKMLIELSRSSYLKDAGAAYRYTQGYKLQLILVQQLAKVICDIDLADCYINDVMEAVIPYLSNKQPLPLQEAAIGFFCDIARFDKDLVLVLFEKHSSEGEHAQKILDCKKNKQIVLQKVNEFLQ